MRDRRWIFALVTGLLVAGAARSVLAQTTGKDGKDAPAKEPAKQAAPSDKEKYYLIELRGKPWQGVFDWLSDQTGLPFISSKGQQPAPTATFNLTVPKGKEAKKYYTMPEIIDIINEGLLAEKYVLIRRASAFTVVPADEEIDPI